jgi:peptide/nickel transport system substrate-binding protein
MLGKPAISDQTRGVSDAETNKFSRRSLLRGAAVGIAATTVPAMVGDSASAARRRRRTAAGTAVVTTAPAPVGRVLRIGAPGFTAFGVDSQTLNADTMAALSGLATEHLVGVDSAFGLLPQLATDWRSNDIGTIWSFTIRPGVKFHNGKPLTAETVAKSFQAAIAAGQGGQLTGVVAAGGVRAIKPNIVRFTLDFPFGLFPYLVSSDNPASAVINARVGVAAGEWLGGTGPFVVVKPDGTAPQNGPLLLTKNGSYWRPLASQYDYVSAQISGYQTDDEAATLFTTNTVDIVTKVSSAGVAKLGDGSALAVNQTKTTAHYQVHMRTDKGPFADRRVRQAMQLSLDRGADVDLGANSPLAQFLPFVDRVDPTPKNVPLAKQLMRDAKKRSGFTASIASGTDPEALEVVNGLIGAASQIGVVLQPSSTDDYLANQWLTSEIGVTKFAHRATPGPLLAATLGSDGAWNAAHYKDASVDALIRTVTASRDIDALKEAATALAKKLGDSVPILVPVFLPRTWVARALGFIPLSISPHGQVSFSE